MTDLPPTDEIKNILERIKDTPLNLADQISPRCSCGRLLVKGLCAVHGDQENNR